MSGLSAHLDGEVLTLDFSRPEASNAFGLPDAKNLQKFLRAHRNARVLIWRSRGRCFSSGGDLRAYAKLKVRAQGLIVNRQIAKILAELEAFPGVTLAIVEGDCWGGGMELLSCFDVVWSVPEAAFGLWQRRLGLSYGWGGWQRLQARMGAARLRERALGGQAFTAFSAHQFGLVNEIVPRFAIESRLAVWRQQQLRLPPEPVKGLKSMSTSTEGLWFKKLWGNKSHSRVLANFNGNRGLS
jgi:enoyl-CoA hydratase